MVYRIFRLKFNGGVHIGEGSLEDNGINLRADTFFSALCMEALKSGGTTLLEQLVSFARLGEIVISDAFPYMDGEYYLPKPTYSVKSELEEGDSDTKKAFRNLKYIPIRMVDEYLMDAFNKDTVKYINNKLTNTENPLGSSAINTRTTIRSDDGSDNPRPYHVGVYRFSENAGLYMIVGANGNNFTMLRELFSSVAKAGIGGKRSSGLGRFSFEETNVPEEILERLTEDYPTYITLSVSLPRDEELEKVIENATYTLLRRSGFVFSQTYSNEQLRKKDLYVLGSGSVVKIKYDGDVYDVSIKGVNKGIHPVYRYAKPLFLGVEL